MTAVHTCLTVALGLVALTAPGEARQGPAADRPATLPRTADWFLSTGNWDTDPQLYVREVGTGAETIVMLHGGWGGEHSGFITAVTGLENDYRFVFYDQRGSLRSPSPDSLITFDRHIEDLELLRQELKLEALHLVGHSMGAVLASAYASKYPQRIRQLTLLAPPLLKDPLPEADKDLHQQAQAALQAFVDRPEVTRELAKYSLDRTDRPLSSREATSRFRINLYKRMLYDIGKWPQLMGGRAMYRANVFELTAKTYPKSGWDYVGEFERRGYPVAIIVGDHDMLDFGNHITRRWIQGIPNVRLSVIEKAGHLLWIDQPERFAQALRQHLKPAARTAPLTGPRP